MGMAITQNGQTLYVAALAPARWRSTTPPHSKMTPSHRHRQPDPAQRRHAPRRAQGLRARRVCADALRQRDQDYQHADQDWEIGGVAMYNSEPAHVVSGRRFLYDASFSSSHGDSGLRELPYLRRQGSPAGILQPDQPNVPDPNVYVNDPFTRVFAHERRHDHPELTRHGQPGPMHWRGDRTGAAWSSSAPPNFRPLQRALRFAMFNVAFPGPPAPQPDPRCRYGGVHQLHPEAMYPRTRFATWTTRLPGSNWALISSLAPRPSSIRRRWPTSLPVATGRPASTPRPTPV